LLQIRCTWRGVKSSMQFVIAVADHPAGAVARVRPTPGRGAISVEPAGGEADHDHEDEVDENDKNRGGGRGIECHPGDVPLVDEGGDQGQDVDGFSGPRDRDRASGTDADQH
jgi:hypothetical protein